MKTKTLVLLCAVLILALAVPSLLTAAGQGTSADTTAVAADSMGGEAQDPSLADGDSLSADSLWGGVAMAGDSADVAEEPVGPYKALKTKFIEGNAGFMSLVALALILGLSFCIERIIYLSLSEINAKRFMADLGDKLKAGDLDGARKQCGETRGPVAAICGEALQRIGESEADIQRAVSSDGAVETAKMERGCSWIRLFIAMAPSLGFLGTVIGMVMAFDQIQTAGDISPTIVAAGMKVALITTIFGIIVALILQVFYNYIVSKIDHLTAQMEESAVSLLDYVSAYKHSGTHGTAD